MQRLKRDLVIALIGMLLMAGGCSDAGPQRSGGPGGTDATSGAGGGEPPQTYSSEVDGVEISWPAGWVRVAGSLDPRPPGNNVQILALATFDGARPGQCSPDPDGAMAQMASDDVLFMLRASDGSGDPRPPRPADLLPAASPVETTECRPAGVDAWRMQFQEHGRPYEAFVAAQGPLSSTRRDELEGIWDRLRLTPIDDGRGGAVVGRPYWHSLYTHCGIRTTTFEGRVWMADPELRAAPSEGNPPRGWGNPDEHGTIELRDSDTAVFTSRDGKRTATFRPRTADDPPVPGCA